MVFVVYFRTAKDHLANLPNIPGIHILLWNPMPDSLLKHSLYTYYFPKSEPDFRPLRIPYRNG